MQDTRKSSAGTRLRQVMPVVRWSALFKVPPAFWGYLDFYL